MKLTLRHLIVLSLVFSLNQIYSSNKSVSSQSVFLDGLVGPLPTPVAQFYTQLKEKKHPRLCNNSLLLYGETGNGKTEIARALATSLQATKIELCGSNIITKYENSGSEKIDEVFDTAESLSREGKRVCIFIDEIDLLASKHTPDDYEDMHNATQTLAKRMKASAQNKNLLVVFATCHRESIPNILADHISTKIEIKKPSHQMRSAILQAHYSRMYLPGFYKRGIEDSMNRLNDSSRASLSCLLNKTMENVDAINFAGKRMINGTNPNEHKEALLSRLDSLESTCRHLEEGLYQDPELVVFIAKCRKFAIKHRAYVDAPAKISPNLLAMVTKKTEGCCIRRTINVLSEIIEIQAYYRNNSISLAEATKIADTRVREYKKSDKRYLAFERERKAAMADTPIIMVKRLRVKKGE